MGVSYWYDYDTCWTTSSFSSWIPRRLTWAHFAIKSHAADRVAIGFSIFAQPTPTPV